MTHAEFLAARTALYEEYKNSSSASAGGGVILHLLQAYLY